MTNESKIEKFIDTFWNYMDSLSNLDAVDYESDKQFRKDMAEELSQLLTPSQVDVEALRKEFEEKSLTFYADYENVSWDKVWNFFAPYITPKTDSREVLQKLRKEMSLSYYESSEDKNTGDWIERIDEYLQSKEIK